MVSTRSQLPERVVEVIFAVGGTVTITTRVMVSSLQRRVSCIGSVIVLVPGLTLGVYCNQTVPCPALAKKRLSGPAIANSVRLSVEIRTFIDIPPVNA